MADLNKVQMIGRLTRDPQLKYLPSNTSICDFGFAVGRKYKTASGEAREETTFVDCSLFGKGADIFNQYMAKGKQCYIEGRLKLDQWDDKSTGQKRSKLSVVVENFIFLGGGQANGQQGDRPQGQRPAQNQPTDDQAPPDAGDGRDEEGFPDDIPF